MIEYCYCKTIPSKILTGCSPDARETTPVWRRRRRRTPVDGGVAQLQPADDGTPHQGGPRGRHLVAVWCLFVCFFRYQVQIVRRVLTVGVCLSARERAKELGPPDPPADRKWAVWAVSRICISLYRVHGGAALHAAH